MTPSSPEILKVQSVNKLYPQNGGFVHALADAGISLTEKDTLALVGPSGCGKSTLLLMLSGLEPPSSGKIIFKNETLHRSRRDIALVLQEYGLFPWKNVRQNVELGFKIRREKVRKGQIDEYLADLGIEGKSKVFPQQLSGGQRQRVALARAMILNPALLLLDEPFAALDTLTREKLQDLLTEKWRNADFSIIFATHNIQEAVILGKRIAIMSGSPGRIRIIIENPSACTEKYRGSDEFYRMARRVRTELEKCNEE